MKNILLFFILSLFFGPPPELAAQQKHFEGTWTKLGTTYVFYFDLYLDHSKGNQVTGYFKWMVTQGDEKSKRSLEHYDPRLGKTAKEFVKGTYNPATKTYKLAGYKKEDPHYIIALDHYLLKIKENGDIEGDTKAHDTWKGRINGKWFRNDQVF